MFKCFHQDVLDPALRQAEPGGYFSVTEVFFTAEAKNHLLLWTEALYCFINQFPAFEGAKAFLQGIVQIGLAGPGLGYQLFIPCDLTQIIQSFIPGNRVNIMPRLIQAAKQGR